MNVTSFGKSFFTDLMKDGGLSNDHLLIGDMQRTDTGRREAMCRAKCGGSCLQYQLIRRLVVQGQPRKKIRETWYAL
jgi:hypothetical protein